MKTLNSITTYLALFAVILANSHAVLADDTEIYIGANAGNSVVRPNVLFIVDTSGSMNDDVTFTAGTYDPSQTYTGSCVTGQVYWSTSGSPPDCSSSNNYFAASSNFCKDSATALGNTGTGFYVGTLARYKVSKSKKGTDTSAWTSLSSSDHTASVECAADSGIDGDGVDTSKLYAANASNGGPWTATSSNSITWSSVGNSYTVYSTNYLNWYWSPGTIVTKTKMAIVKDTFASALNSISGINIGLMRFSSDAQGGYFMAPMQELNSANRTSFINTVNTLSSNGSTPLAETLYEASLYFRGQTVKYGAISSPAHNVSSVLDSSDTTKYKSPIEYQCQKNFVVYMTDGDPTSDTDADTLIKGLPDFTKITGKSACVGDCLDEMAQWMYNSDMRSDLNGNQNVSTFTIGVNIDTSLLLDTAKKGGGKFFPTYGSVDLSNAFTSILTDILAVNTTFIAPSVTVNAFNRLNHRDDLFYAVFRPAGSPNWPGNVKHYKLAGYPSEIVDANGKAAVDTTTGFFSGTSRSIWTLDADAPDGDNVAKGGAAGMLTISRNIYTYLNSAAPNKVDLTAPENKFHEDNTAITKAMLNITTETDDYRTNLLKWSRGIDVLDDNENNDTTDARRSIGDILHSKPVLVTYGGTDTNPDITMFVGSNEGFIHAIDVKDGTERFAFIPKELLGNLDTLFDNAPGAKHPYGMDGPITAWHKDVNGDQLVLDTSGNIEANETVYLYAGMRRGGNHYYALDVTNRKYPKLLWQIDGGTGDFAKLGETWSRPTIAAVKLYDGTTQKGRYVLIFGGGYDTNQDIAGIPSDDTIGNAIYIVDAVTGKRLWWASSDTNADLVLPDMLNSIPSDITIKDIDGDGYADRLYVGDTGGRVWRIDINNNSNTGSSSLATGGILAKLGGSTEADNRRFYYAPDVALTTTMAGTDVMAVAIGSGYREHPLNIAIHDKMYVIYDKDVYKLPADGDHDGKPDYPAYSETDLYNATANTLGLATGSALVTAQTAFNAAHGWYINLVDSTNAYIGEKILAKTTIINGMILFSSFTPVANTQANACAPSQGTATLYAVRLYNAAPAADLRNDGTSFSTADRSTTLVRGGIPPEPTILYTTRYVNTVTGEVTATPPTDMTNVVKKDDIECFVGPEKCDPNNKLPFKVRTPIKTYWKQVE